MYIVSYIASYYKYSSRALRETWNNQLSNSNNDI